ncbi:hypothetical protein AB6A40_010875 [Gnathostoma spinigerum]|uniref:Uncharacterized protein n=1 Tax=Gnathostoma spinigerum TaxID=75299 RepID=A0ABD6EXV4_9BILA
MSQKNDDDDNKDSLSNQETEANEEAADVTESFNNPHRTEESTFDMTQSMTESVVVTMKELTGSLSSESSGG